MKIVRITGSYGLRDTTGPGKHQFLLDSALSRKGYDIVIYTYNYPNGKFERACEGAIEVKKYPLTLRIGHLPFSRPMLKDICEEEADLIHVHGYRNFQADVGAFASTIKHVPLILTSHGSIAGFRKLPIPFFNKALHHFYDVFTFRFALRRASRVVVTNLAEKFEVLMFGIPEEKISVIPHGIDPPPFITRCVRESRRRRRLLMVTRLTSKNNLEFLLRSFKLILKEIPDVELTIVGDELPSIQTGLERGYKKRILDFCVQLGLKDIVRFAGWITQELLWREYLSADVFLWTSRYDNFGHALVEASCCGLPIVSTPVGVAPELVGRNEGGFLVKHDDVKDMRDYVIRLLTDDNFYTMASEHVAKMARKYSIDAMVEKYQELYEKLAPSR